MHCTVSIVLVKIYIKKTVNTIFGRKIYVCVGGCSIEYSAFDYLSTMSQVAISIGTRLLILIILIYN